MPVPHHSVFTGQMPFLPPNQQCQSTEGTHPANSGTQSNNPNPLSGCMLSSSITSLLMERAMHPLHQLSSSYSCVVNTSAYCNNVSKPTYQWTISVSVQLKNAEDAAMLRWQTAYIRQLMTLNWHQTNYIDLVVGVHRQHFHHHHSSFC